MALSNRAKSRARHGLDISLRFSLPDRLSFHAAGDLLDRGYAGLGCTSVSRMPQILGLNQPRCLQHGESLQVKLVIVKEKLVQLPSLVDKLAPVKRGGWAMRLPHRHSYKRHFALALMRSSRTILHDLIIFQDNGIIDDIAV